MSILPTDCHDYLLSTATKNRVLSTKQHHSLMCSAAKYTFVNDDSPLRETMSWNHNKRGCDGLSGGLPDSGVVNGDEKRVCMVRPQSPELSTLPLMEMLSPSSLYHQGSASFHGNFGLSRFPDPATLSQS